MIYELVYSSAPDTFDGPGYGVIAKTVGLPAALEKALLRLCRYDFELGPTAGESLTSPVVYGHATCREASQTWHVLSAVRSAGKDYTNRPVFFAHLLAVSPDEVIGLNIADLLRSPQLFQARWNGEVGTLPPRALPQPGARATQGLWARVAGHADWAKAWVQKADRRDRDASFLVTPAGVDVLGLFSEALGHLPAREAGETTFLTHMNGDISGFDFRWVGLTAGTKFARTVLKDSANRTLDLSSPMRDLPDLMPQRRKSTAQPVPLESQNAGYPLTSGDRDDDFGTYWKADPGPAPTARRNKPTTASAPPPPPPPQRGFHPAWIGVGAALLLVVAGAAWKIGTMSQKPAQDPQAQVAANGPPGSSVQPSALVEPTKTIMIATGPTPAKTSEPPQSGDGKARPPSDPSGKSPANGAALPVDPQSRTAAPSNEIRVIHLDKWPVELLATKKAGEWVSLTRSGASPFAKLRLLADEKLGLKASLATKDKGDNTKDKGDPILQIGLDKEGTEPLSLRLSPVGLLEMLVPAAPSDDLLDRLSFAMVQADDTIGDATARVAFTPSLNALVFSDSPGSSPTLSEAEKRFFLAAHRLSRSLKMEVRIEGVTLSILPESTQAWTFLRAAQLFPGGTTTLPLVIEAQGSPPTKSWKGKLTLVANFNREDAKDKPVIEVLLDTLETKAATEASKPPEPGAPAPTTGPTSKEPAKSAPKEKGNSAQGASTKGKNGSANSRNGAQTQESPEASVERVRKLDDGVLLLEVFRRFGRVYGGVFVRMNTGTSDEDLEIITIGKVVGPPLPPSTGN